MISATVQPKVISTGNTDSSLGLKSRILDLLKRGDCDSYGYIEKRVIEEIGPNKAKGVEILKNVLVNSNNPFVLSQAASVCKFMGKDAAEAKGELIYVLENWGPIVKIEAVRALGEIGPEARNAVPLLISTAFNILLPQVAAEATIALVKVGGGVQDREIVELVLVKLLKERGNEHGTWYAAIHGIAKLDEHKVVPTLIKVIQESNIRLALESISEIGPDAEKAVPALITVLKNGTFNRDKAAEALVSIGKKAVPALERLGMEDPRCVNIVIGIISRIALSEENKTPHYNRPSLHSFLHPIESAW